MSTLGSRLRCAKVLIPLFVVSLFASITPSPARQARPVLAADNSVALENQLPGDGGWSGGTLIADDAAGQIKGYASATSVAPGGSITFYVTVNPAQLYTIDFYRIGWYNGLGGRLRLHAGPLGGTQQNACPTDAITGMIACSWTPGYQLTVPNDWTSGIYLALLTNAAGYQNWMIFVVRDGRPAAFLLQQSVATYQAYNNYPADRLTGKSLYTFNSYGATTVSGETRAVKVSFDRPYAGAGVGDFFQWDIDFVRWLEKNNYDVTYSTDVDTHEHGSSLLNSKAFLTCCHNEYWSLQMFDAVQAARDAGRSIGFFGANGIYRQVRFEPSAGSVPDRVVVGYKDVTVDPVYGPTTTVEFRIPPVNRPEQSLMGVMYCGQPGADCGVNAPVDYVVTNSTSVNGSWIYAGTGLKDGDHIPGIVGYEMDRVYAEFPPPTSTSFTVLSQSPFTDDFGGGRANFANSVIYQAPSGAWVFAAGTMSWAWGLDNFWHTAIDPRIQATTANILNAFLVGAPVVQSLKLTAPATATAGGAFTATVSAVNSQGNLVTGYTGTVHLTSSDPRAVLPADYTFTSGDAGVHRFTVTLKTAGSQPVTATDTANAAIAGTATVTVRAAVAASLSLTAPATAKANAAFNATVTLRDQFGNVADGYTGTVHFTSTDPVASLGLLGQVPADYTFTSGDAGTRTFSVILMTPGNQTITATDKANASLTDSRTVTVGLM